MTFAQSVRVCLAKSFTWRGRASCAELWWFVLFGACAVAAVNYITDAMRTTQLAGALALFAVNLFLLPAYFAAWARRLHDRNWSAWWVLLLVPSPFVSMLYKLSLYQLEREIMPWRYAVALELHDLTLAALMLSFVISLPPLVSGMLPGSAGANRYGEPTIGAAGEGVPAPGSTGQRPPPQPPAPPRPRTKAEPGSEQLSQRRRDGKRASS